MSEENAVEEDVAVEDPNELVYEGAPTGEEGELKIEAVDTKTKRKAIMYKNFGTDMLDAAEKTSEEVVYSNYIAQSKIRCQALMRSRLKLGTSLDDLASWMPGVAMERVIKTTPESAENMFDKLGDALPKAMTVQRDKASGRIG